MEQRQHDFKKVETIGDAIVALASSLIGYELEHDRIKANRIIATLRSNKYLSKVALSKGLIEHVDDPVLQGSRKSLANAYEYYIGSLYLSVGATAIDTCKVDLSTKFEQEVGDIFTYVLESKYEFFHESGN